MFLQHSRINKLCYNSTTVAYIYCYQVLCLLIVFSGGTRLQGISTSQARLSPSSRSERPLRHWSPIQQSNESCERHEINQGETNGSTQDSIKSGL